MQANILINGDGKALLVDFSLSTIKAEFEGTSYYSSTVGGALRWRAPELLSVSEDDVAPNLSTACDISSYGSVALQVCTMMEFKFGCKSSHFSSGLVGEGSVSLFF
jgi:hypothetical protein